MLSKEETIAALSTPESKGAIAIIRLSGDKAFEIINKCFAPYNNEFDLKNPPLHYQILGEFTEPSNKKSIDQVIVILNKEPNSYTGENMAEINCHGGLAVIQEILQCLIKNGARIADPGEFTKRAFLNNKIDLAQAEAVCDIINAQTTTAKNIALKQLKGNLSEQLNIIRDQIINAAAEIELALDFPEEDVDIPTKEKIVSHFETAIDEINNLINKGNKARLFRDGARVLLVGKPNVGKSSVFNAILGKERAIVTPHAGTTRDTIECTIDLNGIPVTLVDSAGVRESQNAIEKIGIEKTLKEIELADLILVLLEANSPFDEEDFKLLDICKKSNCLVVLNKTDLNKSVDIKILESYLPISDIIKISALKKTGLSQLEMHIKEKLLGDSNKDYDQKEDFLITNLRHISLLEKTKEDLKRSLDGFINGMSGELIMVDIYEGLDSIGEITGHKVGDDVLNAIFSRFCIGK